MLLNLHKGPRIINCIFSVKDIKPEKPAEIAFNFKIQHKSPETEDEYLHVFFGFDAGDEKSPFNAEMMTESLYKISVTGKKKIKEEDISKAVYLEAAPMVFLMLNEYFLDLCRKAKIPMIDLPRIDFKQFHSQL